MAQKIDTDIATSIFRRKGGIGSYTGALDSFGPETQSELLGQFQLGDNHNVVVASYKNRECWSVITDAFLAWKNEKSEDRLELHQIRRVSSGLMRFRDKTKLKNDRLIVEDETGRESIIHVEPGKPFFGFFSVLSWVAGNNTKVKNAQSGA